jgi:hypothetical protein
VKTKPGKRYYRKTKTTPKRPSKRDKTQKPIPLFEFENVAKDAFVANELLRGWVRAVNDGHDDVAADLHNQLLILYDSGVRPDWALAGVPSSGFFGWPSRNRRATVPSPPLPRPAIYSDATMVAFRAEAKLLKKAADQLAIATVDDDFHRQLDRVRECCQVMESLCPRGERRKAQSTEPKSLISYPGFRGEPNRLPGRNS